MTDPTVNPVPDDDEVDDVDLPEDVVTTDEDVNVDAESLAGEDTEAPYGESA